MIDTLLLSEIDGLIERLQRLKTDPDYHFHFRSNFKGSGGIGDVEVYAVNEASENNLEIE